MAKVHLTDLSVRALQGSSGYVSYMDTRTPGFGVRVGLRSKTWIIVRGKNRERVTIGRYPDLSLSDARVEAKRLLSAAPEPRTVSMTFANARTKYLEQNFKGSKSRWPYLVARLLTSHFKALDGTQLAKISDEDIQDALNELADRPSEQLHAFRAIRALFKWSCRPPRRWLRHSPMEGYEAPGTQRKGTRTLTDDELKAVWNATGEGSRQVFRLLILWGTRNTETTGLARAWSSDEVLTIPSTSTKNGRDHGIPLLPLAKAILDGRPDAGPYFFQGRYSNEESLTAGALNRMKREIQEETGTSGWQIRDIRRTFRSNMARLKVPREICEVLINHAPPVLDEIYDRYDRLEEKREALAKYEDFLIKLLA
ncbi:MAG TPA: site-specific integrase [Allosphingosinicella sp.]|nr:site-specific integrase [Allosphingosinicella sp.]